MERPFIYIRVWAICQLADRSWGRERCSVYTEFMHDYIVSKVISLGIPMVLIAGAMLWVGVATDYWWFLVMVTIALGYVHFVGGFYYQLKALARSSFAVRYFVAFVVLTVVSVAISLLAITNGYIPELSVGVIGFFLLHGALNEKTLLMMQTGVAVPLVHFLLLAAGMLFLMIASLAHPSFFFTPELTFTTLSHTAALAGASALLGADPFVFARVGFALLLLLALFALWYMAASWRIVLLYGLTIAGFIVVMHIFRPVNFVFLYCLYLSYHFIVWSVVFWQKYRTVPTRFHEYLLVHAALVAFLLFAALPAQNGIHEMISVSVYNSAVFVTFAFIHISVSFLNEPWAKRFIER